MNHLFIDLLECNSELLQHLFITSYVYFNHMRSHLGGYFKTIPYNEFLSDIAFDLQAPIN